MKTTLARAREALAAHDFRRLFAARLVNQCADGLFQIAVLEAVVFDPEGQSTVVGFAKAAALFAVPYSLVGPFVGVFIDRWSRRRILAVAPLVRAAAALLTLGGVDAAAPYFAGALVVISANRFFLSTAGAVMPRLVPPQDLLVGNSIATVGGTFAYLVGATAGGLLADAVGAAPLVVAVTGMWLFTSLITSSIRADLMPEGRPTTPLRHDLARVARETADGVRVLARTPAASFPIVSITLDQFVQGLILVISVVVFRDRFGEGVDAFAWLVAAGGIGTFVGLATVGPVEPRLPRARIVAVAFAVSGLALVAVAPVIRFPTVLAASAAIGFSFAWKKIPIDTMVQEAVPDAYRGRVFAVYDVGYNLSRVIAALVAIPLLPAIGEAWTIGLLGLAFLLWTPVLPWRLRARRRVDVRFYAGGRADEIPRAVLLEGREHIVQEVERSSREERDGERLLVFDVRLDDGRRVRIAGPDGGDAWHLEPPR